MILFVLLFFPKWFQHTMKNTEISLFKLLMKLYIFYNDIKWVELYAPNSFVSQMPRTWPYMFFKTRLKTYSCTWVGGSLIPWDYIVKHVETWGIVHRRRTPLKLEVKIKVNWKSRKTKDFQKTPENKRTAWKRIFTRFISESTPDSVIIISGVGLQNCFN